MRIFVPFMGLLLASGLAAQESAGDRGVYFPQQLTASELLYACASSSLSNRGRERRRFCGGFISGVEEAIRLLDARQGLARPSGICAPKGVSASAFGEMYRKYARDGRGRGKPAAAVVIEALRDAYPCG
jgi:hypothetical protein